MVLRKAVRANKIISKKRVSRVCSKKAPAKKVVKKATGWGRGYARRG